MNQNDLYIEYARVIEMCKGTLLESTPWLGVREATGGTGGNEAYIFDEHPYFNANPEHYEFAIAILGDKPVFVGDVLYDRIYSWQPPKPKRTFMLSGVEFPCPVDWRESSNGDVAVIDGEIFWFRNKMDADLVRDTLSKIFREARDKP